MSMYICCRVCGEPSTKESNFEACSIPEHIASVRECAQISFDATPRLPKEHFEWVAGLLAKEVGLPEDYFLKQLEQPEKPSRPTAAQRIKKLFSNLLCKDAPMPTS